MTKAPSNGRSRRTYIVTGGAGFIGSNIVAALDERGDDVIVVDGLGRSHKWRNIARRRLVDLISPENAFNGIDLGGEKAAAVYHMGAISSTVETDVDLIVERNFRFSCNLWKWCAQNDVPLVYASSASTYGSGENGFSDADDAAHLARLQPLNAYGWSKHLFDRWVCDRIARGETAPPRWFGLKFFNVYGPNEYHKGSQQSVASQIYRQLQKGEPARLFRSYRQDCAHGGQTRDFIWIGDCVQSALWLCDGAHASGLYNIGSGHARSFTELARAVAAAMDVALEIDYIEMPEQIRASFQYETKAQMQKLASTGYRHAPLSLEDGVRKYVTEYLSQPNPYR